VVIRTRYLFGPRRSMNLLLAIMGAGCSHDSQHLVMARRQWAEHIDSSRRVSDYTLIYLILSMTGANHLLHYPEIRTVCV
jgi:hypothetical protein